MDGTAKYSVCDRTIHKAVSNPTVHEAMTEIVATPVGGILWCDDHDDHVDREAFCFCTECHVALCEECVPIGHVGHNVMQPNALAASLLQLLPAFDEGVGRLSVLVDPALQGAVVASESAETAVVLAKAAFARLREALHRREACVVQAITAESKRRAKVLEAQAAELEVGTVQALAVVQVGRAALAAHNTAAIDKVYRLATNSAGLLNGALFLKESPHIACNLQVAGLRRALGTVGRILGDPARECARTCHARGCGVSVSLCKTDDLHELLAYFAKGTPHSVLASTAFCQAVATMLSRDVRNECLCVHPEVLGALNKIDPLARGKGTAYRDAPGWDQRELDLWLCTSPECPMPQVLGLCEAWCMAVSVVMRTNLTHSTLVTREIATASLQIIESLTSSPRLLELAPYCIRAWEVWGLMPVGVRRAQGSCMVTPWRKMLETFSDFPHLLAKLWRVTTMIDALWLAVPSFPNLVVETMRKHPRNEMLQVEGLKTAACSEGTDPSQTASRVAFDTSACLELMLAATELFPWSPSIHIAALEYLWRVLPKLMSRPIEPAIRRMVADTLARPHLGSAVHERAMGLMGFFMRTTPATLREGWLEKEVLVPLSGRAIDVWRVLGKIRLIGGFDEACALPLAMRPRLCAGLLAAMATHIAIEPIQYAGCCLLAEWSTKLKRGTPATQSEEDEVAASIAAMRAHPTSERLHAAACRHILTSDPERPEVVEAVHSALTAHPRLLCEAGLDIWPKQKSLPEKLCDIADAHREEERMLFSVLSVLSAFFYGGWGWRRINRRVISIVGYALKRFPGLIHCSGAVSFTQFLFDIENDARRWTGPRVYT